MHLILHCLLLPSPLVLRVSHRVNPGQCKVSSPLFPALYVSTIFYKYPNLICYVLVWVQALLKRNISHIAGSCKDNEMPEMPPPSILASQNVNVQKPVHCSLRESLAHPCMSTTEGFLASNRAGEALWQPRHPQNRWAISPCEGAAYRNYISRRLRNLCTTL